MNIENVVIARKLSVLEYDMKHDGISLDKAVTKFQALGADGRRILESHVRQLESFRKVAELFDNPIIMVGDDLDRELLRPASLVISLGGDNYLQNVSHFIDQQIILAVNSDPVGSDGSLTNFTADSLREFLPRLNAGHFNIEEWTRLRVVLNGRSIETLSVSEIYIGAHKSTDMSRYILEVDNLLTGNLKEEQKSSGLVIATPAGETGWYSAASRYIHFYNNRDNRDYDEPLLWPFTPTVHKTEKNAFLIVREPFVTSRLGRSRGYGLLTGRIQEQEKFRISWLAHGKGLLSIDAKDEHELTRGDVVEVEISDKPLKVVVP